MTRLQNTPLQTELMGALIAASTENGTRAPVAVRRKLFEGGKNLAHILRQLIKKGWVEAERCGGGAHRDRNSYKPTTAGIEAHKATAAE